VTTPQRPDPDQLLARVRQESARSGRGRLKVFFGAAPGVGKTYAMLEAARALRAEGTDVVAGVVETHGRAETERLLEGLEVLPRRRIEYRGVTLGEFDLDAALARRPAVILVDELAHTNAPGSRHTKRWQDVEELLAAGITVFSTLNVQHIESLNDVVAQITGVVMRETVPDAVFERTDEVELVDVSAEVLLERLREGKVYMPDQAARALEQFFREGNLIALRELALRRTADRVDVEMRDYRAAHGIERTWPAGERVLVCVGPNPASARLIRAGRRMAAALHGECIVLHVASNRQRLSASDRDALTMNLRLAEQLGARTVSLSGDDVESEILAFARRENVTRIVAGKPTHAPWRDKLFGSLLDRLIRHSGDMDVYVITGDAETPVAPVRPSPPWAPGPVFRAAVTVGLATALGFAIRSWGNVTDIAMLYLLAVMISAVRYGVAASVTASVLSIAAFDFCFVPPYYTFSVAEPGYFLTFGVMLIVALLISRLAARIRAQANAAREREANTAALYALSRELAAVRDPSALADALARHVRLVLAAEATPLLPGDDGELAPVPSREGHHPTLESERGVAGWVFQHGRPAGAGTDTLSGAAALYVPLKTSGRTIGVLRVAAADPRRLRDPIQRQLLEALADQAAVAIERAVLERESERTRLEAQAEELRSALLSSLSHDLRTPLGGIEGSASTLLAVTAGDPAKHDLAQTILQESRRMMRLISNLLDMVRVESGALQAHAEWQSLEEIVGVALMRVDEMLQGRAVETRLPADLPLVAVDGLLFEQVIVNLLENAAKYAPARSPIEISASATGTEVTVCVADRGPGLPPGEEARVFEKFYRGATVRGSVGAGLGLTICRAIVTAHGGRIWAEPRPDGGTRLCFTIPRTGSPPEVPPESLTE
jgi:two-component system sensor histidine kinase KdpD